MRQRVTDALARGVHGDTEHARSPLGPCNDLVYTRPGIHHQHVSFRAIERHQRRKVADAGHYLELWPTPDSERCPRSVQLVRIKNDRPNSTVRGMAHKAPSEVSVPTLTTGRDDRP